MIKQFAGFGAGPLLSLGLLVDLGLGLGFSWGVSAREKEGWDRTVPASK